ncbi:unnamed protein product [Caenorhabditis nigoni]
MKIGFTLVLYKKVLRKKSATNTLIWTFSILIVMYGIVVWRKQGFTQSDWIAHFMSIFPGLMVEALTMEDTVSPSFLDTIKQLIPKCQKLRISPNCSDDVVKIAIRKLLPIIKEVEIEKNIIDNGNHISNLLKLNLKSARFVDEENAFELKLDYLLTLNIVNLKIYTTNITEKELNRFLKLWIKGNHIFYWPKDITLLLRNEFDREEVLRGIKHEIAGNEARLKRRDGKELEVYIAGNCIHFEFQ